MRAGPVPSIDYALSQAGALIYCSLSLQGLGRIVGAKPAQSPTQPPTLVPSATGCRDRPLKRVVGGLSA